MQLNKSLIVLFACLLQFYILNSVFPQLSPDTSQIWSISIFQEILGVLDGDQSVGQSSDAEVRQTVCRLKSLCGHGAMV